MHVRVAAAGIGTLHDTTGMPFQAPKLSIVYILDREDDPATDPHSAQLPT
jgi:hypothetical protein